MTPDDTLTALLSTAQTLQRLAIRCTIEQDRIDIDRAGLPAELRDAAAHIAAAEPLVAARPFAVIARLAVALKECADDLAAEIEHRYGEKAKLYPGMARKYAADMEPVERARSALAQALALEAKKP